MAVRLQTCATRGGRQSDRSARCEGVTCRAIGLSSRFLRQQLITLSFERVDDFTSGEFSENLARVDSLIAAAQRLQADGAGGEELHRDVLRAATVFLHSTIEEIVRNLFLTRLPYSTPDRLNKIPLASHESTHRPKPIQLGDLAAFRGRFVENVIIESINRFVDTLNINNSDQLVQCLELADLKIDPVRPFLANVDLLMKRRHQIVHQMDRAGEDKLVAPINDIDEATVQTWRWSVQGFFEAILAMPE